MNDLACDRCGATFDRHGDHTELVRRDFEPTPQPSVVEYLCADCRTDYLEGFLAGQQDLAAR